MSLTAADLKFFAAAVATDNADGGGRRSATVVQTGVLNNLFPDVSGADRSTGMTRLRKLYPSLTNADATALLGGSLVLNAVPSDPATQAAAWRFGDASTTRAAALAGLSGSSSVVSGNQFAGGAGTAGSAVVTGTSFVDSAAFDSANLDQWMFLRSDGLSAASGLSVGGRYCIRRLVSRSGTDLTFDAPLPFSGTITGGLVNLATSSTRVSGMPFGSVPTYAAAATAATTVILAKPGVQIAAAADGAPYVGSAPGFGALSSVGVNYSLGYYRVFFVGDPVTISDEQALAPATATVSTVNVGRTNLDQLAVVGANGLEIVRFVLNGPTPTPTSGAMTCNLAAGTVTFSSVSGFSQPVTVRHRIAQTTAVAGVNGPTITLTDALARDFPAGSLLTSHVPLGDVQARAYGAFAQQAWTRVFSDTLIGNSVPVMYSGLPAVTNQGAESDRWAVVFTAANQFAVYSEALGQIGTGNTVANYAPVNPATGVPFFTLAAASWSASILVGSVFRFNTEGACPPIWLSRCTVPSAASGTTAVGVRILGTV